MARLNVALMVVVPMPEKAHHSTLPTISARTVPSTMPTMWRGVNQRPGPDVVVDLGSSLSGLGSAVVKHLHLVRGRVVFCCGRPGGSKLVTIDSNQRPLPSTLA